MQKTRLAKKQPRTTKSRSLTDPLGDNFRSSMIAEGDSRDAESSEGMMKSASAIALTIALLLSAPAMAGQAAKYGTAQEAKEMLNRAVTSVRSNKLKALTKFNNGQSGFKDRDLYVLCANAKDGTITASPSSNGKSLNSFTPGRKVMQTASEGRVNEITYLWPRPGSITPLKKHTFYTRVSDQVWGVGYWE